VIGYYYSNLKDETLERWREDSRNEVEEEIQTIINSKDWNMTPAMKKMQTINKFYL
jgi:hypothetical protein